MPDNVILFPQKPFFAKAGIPVSELNGSEPPAAPVPATKKVSATCELTPYILPHAPFDVHRVCSEELRCPDVRLIPVEPIDDADPIDCLQNVARAMLTENGRSVFGWRIRRSELFIVAELYAVFMVGTRLIDVTPNKRGEEFVAFAPNYDIPPDIDYMEHRITHRFITYKPPGRRQRVAAEIAAMEPRRLSSERRRAAAAGLTLEDRLSLALLPDMLQKRLELYVECLEELDRSTIASMDVRDTVDTNHLTFLHRRKETLEKLVCDAFANRYVSRAS